MPIQPPQWTEFLSCPVCYKRFNDAIERPISLGCGHTVCKACLLKLHQKKCPFDQNAISHSVEDLPVNLALLQLVGATIPDQDSISISSISENYKFYESARRCIGDLATHLKCLATGTGQLNSLLSRPMQRKLVTMISCQLVEEEGRARAMRSARSLGERTVTELILQHQNPSQLSTNLWAAIRARGCQFLGPAMQEEVLKLILLALEDGSPLSRKVLVLFVVQRLESQYPQASKTAIGHVVQLLYRASCFKVTKREEESSLMQLKEDFRTYDSLRREHDSQVVQIATEAGLRIAPEQWSSLLYGDTNHKSHMQSIIDKLQTPQSFSQSVNELVIALQRTGDQGNLARLRPHLELLANVDPSPDAPPPSWENLEAVLKAVRTVVQGLVDFLQFHNQKKPDVPILHSSKYKTSLCRDLAQRRACPRGDNCTFAHSQEELERARGRNKKLGVKPGLLVSVDPYARLSTLGVAELEEVMKSALSITDEGVVLESSDTPADESVTNKSDSAEPVSPQTDATSVQSLPPHELHTQMSAPPMVSSRLGGSVYPEGVVYAQQAAQDDYVAMNGPPIGPTPGSTHMHSVQGLPPYAPHPYMQDSNIYYPQHHSTGVAAPYQAHYLPDVGAQYPHPHGLGYPGPAPPTHPYQPLNHTYPATAQRPPAHRHPSPASQLHVYPPRYMGVYDPCYATQYPEPWRYYSGGHEAPPMPHSLPPRYTQPAAASSAFTEQPESLDSLHHRRKEILVHLNKSALPASNGSLRGGAESNLQQSPPQHVCEQGPYTTAAQMLNPGVALSTVRRPQTSYELAKSVADTYATSRSTSTLAFSLGKEDNNPAEQSYRPWSSGATLSIASDKTLDVKSQDRGSTEALSTNVTSSRFQTSMLKARGTVDTSIYQPRGGNSTSLYQPGIENRTSIYQSIGLERNSLPKHEYRNSADVVQMKGLRSETETNVYQFNDGSIASSQPSRSQNNVLSAKDESILTSFYQASSDNETSIYQAFCSLSKPEDNEIVTSIKSSLFGYVAASSLSFLDEDAFIPFDPPIVSKYGPISRTARAKLKCSDPVHVTAASDCMLVTPVTAVTPTARPYPISAQTPSRFVAEKTPSSLQKEAKATSVLSMPRVSANMMGSSSSNQPYTLWESGYHQPLSHSTTIQERLQHELARVEHQIHVRENSTRELSQQEKLQCELQAIEQQISMKTGKPPNASLEMTSSYVRKPERSPNMRVVVPKLGSVLDADIDLNTALTPEEEQELNELHLSVQSSRRENESDSPTD